MTSTYIKGRKRYFATALQTIYRNIVSVSAGKMRYRIGIVSVPEKISNIGIVSDISDISAGRKIRIAAVALYGAAVAAVALHLTLGRRPGSRTEWLAARLGSLRHTLRLPHHGMHCLEPSGGLFIPLH